MSLQSKPIESFDLYHHSLGHVPGSIRWYGEDYFSFAQAMDNLIQRLKIVPLKKSVTVTLHLHPPTISAAPIEEWKLNYCTEKILANRAEYVLMRRQGFNFLLKGCIALWACLSIAYLFDQTPFIGAYSQLLGKETFLFIGWVILWKPIEMMVFEPWALKHDIRLLEKINHTPFHIVTA